jgi:5,6-dimethylbenzimidazole synthase
MSYQNLLDIIRKRRSFRRFKSDPLPEGMVEKVLEAARLSPSAGNSQPWEFVVVQDTETRKSISKGLSSSYKPMHEIDPDFYYPVSVQPHLHTAPVLIVVIGDTRLIQTYPKSLEGIILIRQSLAVCVYAIQLAAASLGIASAWATIQVPARERVVRELIGIPEVYTVDHIIPLGYPDEEEEGKAQALKPVRERASSRRELGEIIHYERYDMERFRSDEKVKEFVWSKSVTRVPRS